MFWIAEVIITCVMDLYQALYNTYDKKAIFITEAFFVESCSS